jgi:hypothetical protein
VRASIDALHEPVGKAKADLPAQCHDSRACIPIATRMQYNGSGDTGTL